MPSCCTLILLGSSDRFEKCLIFVEKLRHFALRFVHSHSGATGVCLPICRVVYVRCGAKLPDVSSKIDGRGQRPSSQATASS